MPAYAYRCRNCDNSFEVRRPMTAAAGTVTCPQGHDDTTRVFTAVAVGAGARDAAAPAAAGGPVTGGCCGGGCCG